MARVTVEDCIDKVDNRFKLVLLASHRARMISQGAPITVSADNDKKTVIALREIADQTISAPDLEEELIHTLQSRVEVDEPEEQAVPLIAARPDSPDAEPVFDRMTEEELLKGMQGLVPPDRKDEYS